MKRSLLITFCLLFGASMAFGQPGSIGVFAAPGATDCNLDNTGGFMSVYVVHVYSPGATSIQFKLETVGVSLTWVGDTYHYPLRIGTTQSGIWVDYDACLTSPILAVTVNYTGTSDPCDKIEVAAHPAPVNAPTPGIYVEDCATPVPNLLIAKGGAARINQDGTCTCSTPVQETTWGRVKALYQ